MLHTVYCSVDLHFPGCHSLKEKRMILKSLKERLRGRYNIALAEEDHSDLWQRTRLAVVSVAHDKQALIVLIDSLLEHLEDNKSIQVLESSTEYD
jgi:uncharacterized protein YlxP (DUF503 family)